MAMAKSAVIFFLVMMGLCVVSNSMALVYKVGDNDGWSSLGHVDYAKWASTKNFHVGDALRKLLNPLIIACSSIYFSILLLLVDRLIIYFHSSILCTRNLYFLS